MSFEKSITLICDDCGFEWTPQNTSTAKGARTLAEMSDVGGGAWTCNRSGDYCPECEGS